MKYIFKKLQGLEPGAALSLKIGLVTVVFFSALLLSYICKTDSIAELMIFKDAIPSLDLSVFIVFGGAVAFDAVLNENK